jgi:hypothetical protein
MQMELARVAPFKGFDECGFLVGYGHSSGVLSQQAE